MSNFVFFLLFILFLVIFYKCSKKKPSIPKGLKELPHENGLPIIGIFHHIKRPFCIHFANLGKRLGPIFRVRLGMRDIVVLNNYDIIKKTLKDDGDNFAGRFNTKYYKEMTRGVGIGFIDEKVWVKQRSYVLSILRDLGANTSRYQDIIQDECSLLLRKVEQIKGGKNNFSKFISISISNIISKFIMNKRSDEGVEVLKYFIEFLSGFTRSKDIFQILSIAFPFLDNSTLFFKFIVLTSYQLKVNEKIHKYYEKEIEEHLKKLDFNSEGDDFIDRFLIKQREVKTKKGNVESFTDFQLVRNIFELFMASYETVTSTLEWSIMFMSKYPEIQNKVYLEIMHKIGNKQPSMNDKVNLPYTQAVMDEIHRMSSITPLGLMHQTLEDSSVDGFFIPKKSIVFPNLYACHHDPNTWENPMEFKPKRFLSYDNNEELKYASHEDLIPFGLGKRQCLGESLAKMEFFIFFTRILQNFKVSFCEEINEEKYKEVLLANDGIVRQCSINDFIFTIRN